MKYEKCPLLIIVSAPSGAGKSTLCRKILERMEEVAYSVSCTTRAPRSGEQDGVHYHFMDEAAFQRRVGEGAFLEYARVHGAWYGTLRETVREIMRSGRDVLMDIDVQGAAQIREAVRHLSADDPLRRGLVDVFIAPPSIEALRERLRRRAQDAREEIDRRVRNAEEEMAQWHRYRYCIVNDELDEAVRGLESVIVAEHYRVRSS